GRALEGDAGALEEATDRFRRAEAIAEGTSLVDARLCLARVSLARGDRAEQLRLYASLLEEAQLSEAERVDLLYRYADAQLAAPDTAALGLVTLRGAFAEAPQ